MCHVTSVVAVLLLAAICSAQSYVITTVAGTTSVGDGGPATEAQLLGSVGVAVDAEGNVYVADTSIHRIRKIDTSGTITTIAGDGVSGFSGDGGPAAEARISTPFAVAVDSGGNIYIADTGNNRLRKVDTSGTITTIAGISFGVSGISLDGAGNVYVAYRSGNSIHKVDGSGTITTIAGVGTRGFGGDGGPATAASNLYIADERNDRVRKVDTSGTMTTIAGDGTSGFGGDGGPATAAQLRVPLDVAVDSTGNVYIADAANARIRKVDTSGMISTIAGDGGSGFGGDGGPAIAAQLGNPAGVALDNLGNVYVADSATDRIRKIDTAGTISTIAGDGTFNFSGDGGPATAARLGTPLDVALDSAGSLYIADIRTGRVRKVDTSGKITTIAGGGTTDFGSDGGPATDAHLNALSSVTLDGANNIYVAERLSRIRKVDTLGPITTIAGNFSPGFSGDGGPATDARLTRPEGFAVDGAGNLYISDSGNERVRKVDTLGAIATIAGDGTAGFSGDGGPATDA